MSRPHRNIRTLKRSALRAFLTLLSVACLYGTIPFPGQEEKERVTVEPSTGLAGDFGTWRVCYQAGAEGIQAGGGIRVELPDSWHAGDRNSANPLQATNPKADHYVSGETSKPAVQVAAEVENESSEILVKSSRTSLDGRSERYVFVVRLRLAEGRLDPGDTLCAVYGDRSHGSRGMRAPVISTEPEAVLVAVDSSGSGRFRMCDQRPTLRALSGRPAEMLLTAPSTLQVGRPALLHLAVVDSNANPVDSFQGDAEFEVRQGRAEIANRVELNLERGWGDIEFVPLEPGILRVQASALGGLLVSQANPVEVTREAPEQQVYWGDLHSHSRHSWDGVGSRAFEYARYVSRLDFYAMTDHSRTTLEGLTQGLGPHVWEEYQQAAETHNQPGSFVTFHAYEASFGSPFGHHNVYFRDRPGRLLSPEEMTLPELWNLLQEGEALTIPHHTGKFPNPVRWDIHHPEFRRNLEIYSAHGLSEAFDPAHPLSFEHSDFTAPSRSVKSPQFAQDAWIRGLMLSSTASSDDHRAQPGQPHWGLVATRARGLTRKDIFAGLYNRHTYATTGARILLEFTVDGIPMGQETAVSSPPLLEVKIHGIDEIVSMEVLRHSVSEGAFKVLFQASPNALDFRWRNLDLTIREDSIYYVRVTQRGQIRGRPVMAWSSPVWVKYPR